MIVDTNFNNFYTKFKVFHLFLTELLAIDDVEVTFGSYEFKARYVPNDYTIYIDNKLTEEEKLYCLFHEIRHAYQHQELTAINQIEDTETIKRWHKEFKTYKGYGTKGYHFQDVELDATCFAEFIANLFFDKQLVFEKEFNVSQVKRRLNKFYNTFRKHNILEAFNHAREIVLSYNVPKTIN